MAWNCCFSRMLVVLLLASFSFILREFCIDLACSRRPYGWLEFMVHLIPRPTWKDTLLFRDIPYLFRSSEFELPPTKDPLPDTSSTFPSVKVVPDTAPILSVS